jgi:hypothetical protein
MADGEKIIPINIEEALIGPDLGLGEQTSHRIAFHAKCWGLPALSGLRDS